MASENGEVSAVIDSLPYYDNDLERDPGLKDRAEKLIQKELKQQASQGLHPGVPPPPTLFANSPLLQQELARVESHQPIPPIDTFRYQLPGPTNSPATEEDWEAALKNAQAQLEHQRLRHMNLALLQQYGSNAWRIHNFLLEQTAKNLEKAVEDLKQLTVEVNRERKNFQTGVGAQLTTLETRWTELISSVLQIEMANVALEAEIDKLNKREVELSNL
ncbi:BCAS2 domain-containing protein [Phanerochaete sordida]|uniref:BCAS2 domain-containing protein n=1 Tax=Phanerochaete sordida TaxID=48140 RepID=A0A9P3G2E4_9APHY|nr:BCAS2 domain-containing protein [Phanerochaete sordida]